MVNYRRNKIKEGCYFFTVTLHDRQSDILIRYTDLLRKAMIKTQEIFPYKTEAIVILPEHLHTIWKLPPEDHRYSERWQKIKSFFTHDLVKNNIHLPIRRKGEYTLWQSRYWEHTINDEKDYETHVNYIHYNPVKHGYVKNPKDWSYSSFHKFVKNGLLPLDWGSDCQFDNKNKFGE